MSQTYSLIVVNNTNNIGDFCLYQKDPVTGVPDVTSLAWFVKPLYPRTQAQFSWKPDYDFVWGETGPLAPGVVFTPGQVVPADLISANHTTLDCNSGAFFFTEPTKGSQPGTLSITEAACIPLNKLAVGIGMSGFGTFVMQARPNLNLIFTPHPEYWITFGEYTQGQVLDISEITNVAQISFPSNVYSMTAILSQDNTWTVHPTH